MKISKLLAPLVAAAALAVPMACHATLLIHFKYDVTDVIFSDNGCQGTYCDQDLTSGSIAYTGAFGTFSFVVGNGTSDSNPLDIHLTAGVSGTGSSLPLTIEVTETGRTDFTPGPVSFSGLGSTAGGAGTSTTWGAFVDASNAQFGTGVQIGGTNVYGGQAFGSVLNLQNPYSVTLSAVFDFSKVVGTGKKGASADLGMQTVPEPTSIALAGLALLGLGMARRRKA